MFGYNAILRSANQDLITLRNYIFNFFDQICKWVSLRLTIETEHPLEEEHLMQPSPTGSKSILFWCYIQFSAALVTHFQSEWRIGLHNEGGKISQFDEEYNQDQLSFSPSALKASGSSSLLAMKCTRHVFIHHADSNFRDQIHSQKEIAQSMLLSLNWRNANLTFLSPGRILVKLMNFELKTTFPKSQKSPSQSSTNNNTRNVCAKYQ